MRESYYRQKYEEKKRTGQCTRKDSVLEGQEEYRWARDRQDNMKRQDKMERQDNMDNLLWYEGHEGYNWHQDGQHIQDKVVQAN